jgi:hypothetical protein
MVRISNQVAVAIFAALAVLAVFVYPLTVGPPAPQQQKQFPIFVLLAWALAAIVRLVPIAAAVSLLVESPLVVVNKPSERLALICTRLC